MDSIDPPISQNEEKLDKNNQNVTIGCDFGARNA